MEKATLIKFSKEENERKMSSVVGRQCSGGTALAMSLFRMGARAGIKFPARGQTKYQPEGRRPEGGVLFVPRAGNFIPCPSAHAEEAFLYGFS